MTAAAGDALSHGLSWRRWTGVLPERAQRKFIDATTFEVTATDPSGAPSFHPQTHSRYEFSDRERGIAASPSTKALLGENSAQSRITSVISIRKYKLVNKSLISSTVINCATICTR
jgi:hypothetical protein